MTRNVTVTFDDGSSHVYNGVPDTVTPEQITERASSEFSGKGITHLDGGKSVDQKPAKDPADAKHSTEEYEDPQYKGVSKRLLPLAKNIVAGEKESTGKQAVGFGESLLSGVTGIGSTAVGGLAGGARALYSLASGEGLDTASRKGSDTIGAVQHATTYQPRTDTGKAITGIGQEAGNLISQITGKAGGAAGSLVGPKTEAAMSSIGEAAPALYGAVEGLRGTVKQAGKNALRESAPIPGKDVTPLRELQPDEAARMQRMTDQGIKPTLGQVTRDPAQFRFEEQTGKTEAGARLRERELDTNDALIKAIDDTDKMRVGKPMAENERQVGHSVATALEEKSLRSKAKIKELYQKAEQSGETKAVVDTKPLEKWLKENEAEATTVPAITSIGSKLNALKRTGKGKVTVDDVENLYQSANALSKPGDPSSVFMGQVKRKIDQITDGAGGDLYREARKARLDHAMEFEDRSAIANLIDKKAGSRTDYKTANEDVFHKTVVNSSLTELKDVTNSLLSTDPKTHPEGYQAMRELQAQTINHVLDESTKGIATNERGVQSVSPAGFRRAVRNIGRDKLDWILGDDAVKRLDNTLQNTVDVKTTPGKVGGSDTNLNVRDSLEAIAKDEAKKHLMSMVPYVGKPFTEWQKMRKEKAHTNERIDDALNPRKASAESIRTQAAAVKAKEKQFRMSDNLKSIESSAPAALGAYLKPKEDQAQ